MENQTFKIDETKLNNIRNRALIKSFTLLGVVLLLISGMQYFEWGENQRGPSIITTIGVIPLLLLPAYIGVNRLKKPMVHYK